MGKEKRAVFLTIIMPVLYLAIAVYVVWGILGNGEYPTGSDTMYHIYRGEMVYRAVGQGDWYPLFDSMWYNGVELLRYGSPLPAYIMAATQALAGGDALNGYLIFAGVIFFVGAMEWLYIGKHIGRPLLGAFLGILWFFMPYNLFVFFQEGNLARVVCMQVFPIFFYCVLSYRQRRDWKLLPTIALLLGMMILCHAGFAGLLSLGTMLYLFMDVLFDGKLRRTIEILPAMVIGAMLTGIWLLPFLSGGITRWDYSETMNRYFQDMSITLAPLERMNSNNAHGYFGAALLAAAIIGGIFVGTKKAAGFWCGILFLMGTSTTAYLVFHTISGGEYIWMMWLFPAAFVMIFMGLLRWDNVRRPILLLLCLLMCMDCIPSLPLIFGTASGKTVEERLEDEQEGTLIARAQELTSQRMILLDGGYLESMGAYLASNYGTQVPQSGGYGWRAAATAENVAQLERALTGGSYLYLFDRCLELGNDTVLIKTAALDVDANPIEDLDIAASRVGYTLADYNEGYRLYHIDTAGDWGTVTDYEAIGIGIGAGAIALDYPALEETTSPNLSDYTYEELVQYKLVYLAGFTYDDRDYAEKLVTRLSENGVRVVIAADGIPEDRSTHDQSFLGVVCNPIRFSNGYPELDTLDGIIDPDLFPRGHLDWNTVYLEGLDECWGSLYDNDVRLEFYGTVKNENIVMIGLNLTYHYALTKDAAVGGLLEHAMTVSSNTLPRREIVPINLDYDAKTDTLSLRTSSKKVNTALAYQDTFYSAQNLYNKNHLTVVDSGTSTIHIRYPYRIRGLLVSILGMMLGIVYCMRMRRHIKAGDLDKKQQKEQS